MTKLTLSVDEAVVDQAKQIARQNGTSVSAMFSQFVQALGRREAEPGMIGPLTRKASGLVPIPPDKGYEDLLGDALMDKYEVTE